MRPGLISSGDLADYRERLGSTPRTTTICCPWPEGFRGPRYERGSQWLDSTHGCQFIPTPTEFRRRPSEGGLRVFDSLRGCHFAVEAHRDVQRIGSAQAAGANPAIGTSNALQALTAERRIRNPEVRSCNSIVGTTDWVANSSETETRLLSGVIQVRFLGGRPICPSRTDSGRPPCKREVRCKSSVGLQSMEGEAGGVLHAVANRWVPSCGMAFEWSALRQSRGSHVACLVGLNPTMIREGRERSTRSASANTGR